MTNHRTTTGITVLVYLFLMFSLLTEMKTNKKSGIFATNLWTNLMCLEQHLMLLYLPLIKTKFTCMHKIS